jgi:hypothetical protein
MHFLAKADNARFAAYCIWMTRQRDNEVAARETQYNGNPQIALSESFRREASVALELIIKAVIAQRIECKISKPNVPSIRLTHDLVELWEDASLPRLPRADKHRLLIAKIILYWAARYPAPKRDRDYYREQEAIERLQEPKPLGKMRIIKPRSFDWNDVERIYQIAHESFWAIRGAYVLSPNGT